MRVVVVDQQSEKEYLVTIEGDMNMQEVYERLLLCFERVLPHSQVFTFYFGYKGRELPQDKLLLAREYFSDKIPVVSATFNRVEPPRKPSVFIIPQAVLNEIFGRSE